MATGFLDKPGVSTLWGKVKELVDSKTSEIKADMTAAATELGAILGDPTNDPTEGGE